MPLADHVQSALAELEQAGLLRAPRVIDSAQGPEVLLDGRSVINLCSNDYLGLAADPALARVAADAIARWGVGSGASRHIVGTLGPHPRAEAALAAFVAKPRALLFSSGYAANVGCLQAVVGPGDVVFSDALNHASLIDGCRLSRAAIHVYPHGDARALDALIDRHRPGHGACLIVTESLFSMDGDEAPLAELAALAARHDAALVVDEAHALGVLGPGGRGLCAEHAVQPALLIGTLGKAFGLSGAFCAGPEATLRLVENRARSYVFSTAPPPHLALASVAALELVAASDARRARLSENAGRLRAGLAELGYRVAPGRAPIVPIHVGPARGTMALSAALLEHDVFVHGIRPPTVPPHTSRLRVTVSAAHDDTHLARALAAFEAVAPLYRKVSC